MWYVKPSVNFNDALPIGNGRLGAMVYGGISEERISLNEQTLWSGMPVDGNNPQAKNYLPLVRAAALAKQYKKADSLSRFMQGPWTESYMPMADLFISYRSVADSSGYTRELNLDSAIARVSFGNGREKITRTYLSSFPDKVIAIGHTTKKKSSLSFEVRLTSKLRYSVHKLSDNHIVLRGKCPDHVAPPYIRNLTPDQAVHYSESGEGMNFEVHVRVKNVGGKISVDKHTIRLDNADAATIYISAATSYNG
ncbi:MAG: glycoside hydrolase family 95 protein, partial [Proteobacteria bacterium]